MQTDMIMVRESSTGIHISPAQTVALDSEDRDDDIIIFNADRDNGSVGIEAGVFANILRKLDKPQKKSRAHGSHR